MWDLAAGSQELLALVDPDLVVSVVPNTVRAAAVAKRVSGELSARRHGLVVRTIAGAAIEPMEIAELLDIPLWGVVPSDSRVVEQVEQGLGPAAINLGGFTRAVTAIVDRLVDHAPER